MRFITIIIGNLLITSAYAFITVPKGIVNGGVTSFAMVMGKLSGGDVAVIVNIIMLLLLLICLLYLGRSYFIGALFSGICYMALFTFFHHLNQSAPLPLWLSVIIVGIGVGSGCYLCIRAKSTTIGFDTIALILYQRNPKLNIAWTMYCCNTVVLLLGAFTYGFVSVAAGLALTLVQTLTLNILLKKFGLQLGQKNLKTKKE